MNGPNVIDDKEHPLTDTCVPRNEVRSRFSAALAYILSVSFLNQQ
jgi:hypothetical protein